MEDKYSLEGKLVTVFLRGSWDFTGRVEFSSKDKIVLEGDIGSLVVYKENIVAAMIVDEKKLRENIDPEPSRTYDTSAPARMEPAPASRLVFEQEQDQGQQGLYGSIIPEDMLEGTQEDDIPVSFSISMSQLKNIKPKENLEDGSTEKTPEHRGKNKERV